MAEELIIHDGLKGSELHEYIKPTDGVMRSTGYDPQYVVKGMFDSPSQLQLIPQSEWSERLKDKVAQKSLLSDIRLSGDAGNPIPSLDQNGKGYCHTSDTEVLTNKGWVPWPEYNWIDDLATINPDTNILEFQPPLEKHVYKYDGDIIYSTNRRIDFGVTPNHRMLVRKWDEKNRKLSEDYTFQLAEELGWYFGLMHAPAGFIGTELKRVGIEGDREYDGDDFIAMLAIISSCGYAGGSEKTLNKVSFCCFKEELYEKINQLASRVGFKEQPNRKGVWNREDAGALANWIRYNCYTSQLKSPNKKVPEIIKWVSERQIKLFLEHFHDKDHNTDREHYYSSSKRMIDDLQELHLRISKRGTITKRGPRESILDNGKIIKSKECYELHISQTEKLSIDKKKQIYTEHYNGLVYCATVPNGTLITRRNGSVLISGNCWAHSTTSAVMLVRALNNQPYVPLSAYAVAATIKKGRDEGGWCGLSAQFAREKGIPSQNIWPQGDCNYTKYDKPETWTNAQLHKIEEEWVDLSKDVYDQNLTWDQIGTCCLLNIPGPVDFNWWSHSVSRLDLVEGAQQRMSFRINGKLPQLWEFDLIWGMNHPVTGGFGLRIWNSWSDTWSDRGMGVLTGSKAVPDSALAVRVVGASTI